LLLTTVAHADAVTDWNETAIRAAASIGISTGWQSRIVAITHAAMFDAVNTIERKYTTYAVEVSPPAGASAAAAAIRAADSTKNTALTSDPHWEPLLDTPAHPDYPSGHATYGGAAAEVLKAVLGDDHVDVSFVSTGVRRTYTSFSQLDREIIDARVWGGIHFRQTDEVSSALGHQIGDYAVKTWLRPASGAPAAAR
jgi:hypothetical protein